MNFGFVDPWHLFLPREPGHVISLMGSGGKTSLMRAMAEVYRELGIPVVMTTTTACEELGGVVEVEFTDLPAKMETGLPDQFFLHGGRDEAGKWRGLGPGQVDDLGGLLPDRMVLVEVDGAAKLPVKLHREGEPVWPARTSLGVVVIGTAAIGAQTGHVLHRFGRQAWKPLEDLKSWTIWEWDHALTLLREPGGYLDHVPLEVPCVLALTGMDEQPDSIGLFDFVGRAMADPRLPLTLFCDLASVPPVIRTVCQEEPEES